MKIFLIILAVLVAAFAVLAVVAPKEMTVERSIVINVPKDQAFEFLRFAKNQDTWSPWLKMDPDMRTATTGTDGEVGFIYAWEGNKDVGVGEQEIKKITPTDRIDMELRFKEPMEGNAEAWFLTEDAGNNQTKVTWGFHSVSKFPYHVICYIMNAATDMMNKTFDQGLNDLKTVLEVKAAEVGATIAPAETAPAATDVPVEETAPVAEETPVPTEVPATEDAAPAAPTEAPVSTEEPAATAQ